MRTDARVLGAVVALALHASAGVAVWRVDPGSWRATMRDTVDIDVREPPAPPVVEPPPPAPSPPPVEPPPRPVLAKRVAPRPVPPSQAPPPPPSQDPPPEPPPNQESAPPVFGVSLDATVSGDSAVAVPVGNTLATSPRKVGPARALVAPGVPGGTGDGDGGFSPVSETSIAELPRLTLEVPTPYPADARRLGLEGQVRLRVGIDRKGRVRLVKAIQKAGHGFDEAAEKAMWQFKWTPARTRDGQAVDFQFTYKYIFELPR